MEALTTPSVHAWVAYPIVYDEVWTLYGRYKTFFWTAGQVRLQPNNTETSKSSQHMYGSLVRLLEIFETYSEACANELILTLSVEVQISEARAFYGLQIAMQTVHLEALNRWKDYCSSKIDNDSCLSFSICNKYAVRAQKASWLIQWRQAEHTFAERLVASAIMECIFHAGFHCVVHQLKTDANMVGICHSNDLIMRDRRLNVTLACVLYKLLHNRLSQRQVQGMCSESVAIEQTQYIDVALVRHTGMLQEDIVIYVQQEADTLLECLGYEKLYRVVSPYVYEPSTALSTCLRHVLPHVGTGRAKITDICDFDVAAPFED